MNPNSSKDFLSILEKNNNKNILISFTKATCPACNQLKQYLQSIKSKYSNKVEFVNLDTQIFKDLAIQNNIEFVPTSYLINYSNNKITWSSKKIVGLNPKEIENILDNKINSK
jgi:thioredoxin-like negative regulator of GroEL